MNSDEMYRAIGYAVVIIFGLYVVSKSIRFQTGILVEGMTAAERRATNTGDSGFSRRPAKCGTNTSTQVKMSNDQLNNYIKAINVNTESVILNNCTNYDNNFNAGLLNSNDYKRSFNSAIDEIIYQQKMIIIILNTQMITGDAKIAINDPNAVSIYVKNTITPYVESVKSLEACKQYYNQLWSQS